MAVGLKIINGDWEIVDRKLSTVQGTHKVVRDMHKFLSTDKYTPENETDYSRYNPSYGVELNRRELYINLPQDTIIDNMNVSLTNSLRSYIALQEGRSNLSVSEVITDLQFHVYKDADSKTSLKINITASIAEEDQPVSLGTYTQEVV